MSVPVLEVHDLVKNFSIKTAAGIRVVRRTVQAVSGVSFTIDEGQTVGLVGESGSGKTTVGRCVLRLIEPTGGSVKFKGQELVGMDAEGAAAPARRRCRSCSRTRTRRSTRR